MLSKVRLCVNPRTWASLKFQSVSLICAAVLIVCSSGLRPIETTLNLPGKADDSELVKDPVLTSGKYHHGIITETGNTIALADVNNITGTIGEHPVLSGITITSITERSVVISWTTDVPATSQVKYGTTAAYGLSTLVDSTLVLLHSLILDGLAPGTQYHFQVNSINADRFPGTSANTTFTTASLAATLGTMDTHTIFAYPAGKIVPWTSNPAVAYDSVMKLAWNYLLNSVPNDPLTLKPAYYSRSYLLPNNQQMADWDHNPAGLYAMLVESALKYYGYSGNANVMQLVNDVALWHLDNGMTTPANSWASVPYSEGQYGSLTYGGAPQADGIGNLEPDKIGELGYAWLQLYKFNGNVRFRDAAIQAGNVLSSKVRTGTVNQSPWPFRVKASNGAIVEDYCSNIIGPVKLFDGLIAAGLGDSTSYQAARTTAWNWMMTFPMQNNVWAQYFEDVSVQQNYNNNLNQYNAMMVARYLLEHPEFDPNWETHVRGLITWVENIFGQVQHGAMAIREQIPVFAWFMGSHTSRYASVNAMLFEKTGDLLAKEKAYRSFNWATYMARSNGVVIDGPLYGLYSNANQWFTDGYGDYVRHFMTGLGAVPEWAPFNQTHLLRSSTLIKNIFYSTNNVTYTTYDRSSIDVLRINFNPVTITADGVPLLRRTDLNEPGWTLDIATKTLRIFHTDATQISIRTAAAFVNTICPGGNTNFVMPKPGSGYSYQWQTNSTGTEFVDILNSTVYSGANTDTLRLTTPPTYYYGFKYRCIATKSDTVIGSPFDLKFQVTWHGNANTVWSNPANWSCNYVPDPFTDVVIPGDQFNNPVVNSYATANGISISPGAVLTVSPGIRLDIRGK